MSPAPFPQVHRGLTLPKPRWLALAKLAVDSMVDGALHEGVSARIIAKLARRRDVPAVRAVLKEIAADEGRHAAHGWAVVEWCLAEGGAPVAHAIVGALRSLPTQLRSELPPAAGDGSWERWGIHGHALETDEYSAALDHLRRRVTTMATRFTAKICTPARAASEPAPETAAIPWKLATVTPEKEDDEASNDRRLPEREDRPGRSPVSRGGRQAVQ